MSSSRSGPRFFSSLELDSWRDEAHQAGKRLLNKRKALEKVADKLRPQLAPAASVLAENLQWTLDRLVAARGHASALYQQLGAIGGLRLPAGWLPTAPDAERQLHQACEATEISRVLLREHPAMWALFEAGFGPADLELLERLRSGWQAWRGALHCGPAEFAFWAGESGWHEAWQRDGSSWLAALKTDGLLPVQRWGAALAHADVLAEAGLTEFRTQLLRGVIDPDEAEEAYRRGVATTALAERLRAGEVEYFDAQLHDTHIDQFETVAARLRAALPEHLPSVLVRRRPFNPHERRGRVADFTAELRRKRGGRSFRELFQSYPDIVLALTPCVLVSPASAGHFLAPDAARFDLVVFDEASQIRVAEAIGAMGRGTSVVVVGDSKQMPPTTVMQASHGEEEDAPDSGPVPEDLDSILSEAVESGLPQRWLSWHYRSRDESLIAFSNRYYYDNKLSSLPSPGADPDAGVRWRRVDGQFDRGESRTNAVEAREVVAEIVRRLREPATRADSIGVVTFNVQQRDLILDLLEDSTDPLVRERMSEDETEPIFVKNLENVQGDERDVILFSLAFSTNPETGKLPLNFGPLSQTGGERRLNVAITRARRQVVLFSSFDPGDIDLARTTAIGTRHLRAYCELAASGVDRLGDLSSTRRQRRDRIREEVAAAIRTRGHEVITGHGLSDFTVDIAVRVPGAPRWQVAVILDGPQWSARPTVADRDSAPAYLRGIMGWPELVRFWLPAWVRDRAAILDRVDAAVERAVGAQARAAAEARTAAEAQLAAAARAALEAAAAEEQPEPSTPVADPFSGEQVRAIVSERRGPTPTQSPAEVAVEPMSFQPYEPTLVGDTTDLDVVRSSARVQAAVRAVLREVIATEGPVEQHRLARLTLKCFDLHKTNADRRASVLALVDPGTLRVHPIGTFAWPSTLDPEAWRGFRRARNSSDRDFDEIAPEEIVNAVCHALASARRAEQDLLRATLERLGYRRLTEKIESRLRYGLEFGQERGRIARDPDGRYRLGPTT
ncbi:AAA domain-containing protein [Asanoa hainanensis]|uniref:AAA domain-containing protein n=1 Tax=Asanoa hainanensis TaxID=560556 RepID=A0A239IM54_9ACTN|nr:AAA domain-containing protein [Asanoa hainanensis]SNS94655.1 AAA domain-containing protein [Asanoa hainanensis]